MRRNAIGKFNGMTPEQFQNIRKELGYTQDQLAVVIGYSRTQVGNLERGTYGVENTLALLMRLLLSSSRKKREEAIYQTWKDYGYAKVIRPEIINKLIHRNVVEEINGKSKRPAGARVATPEEQGLLPHRK